jgi:hypothetical protein
LLDILEKYWSGKAISLRGEGSEETADRIFGLLGDIDDFKRWLTASLWKNIRNQTAFETFPMGRWVEFVQIGERYMDAL